MKMFKKLMAVALAGVMALVVLTGCASNAVKTKDILDSMKDTADKSYTLEDAGEADAAQLAAILKEYKAKDEYKDMKLDDMLNDETVKAKLTEKLVPADNKDMVKVSVEKVENYKSKYFTDGQYNEMATSLYYGGAVLAYPTSELGKTAKVSLKADQIGDDTYVFAVIRVAPKK